MNYRPWWLEVLICSGCVVTAVLIIASLSGCATSRDAEVCYMKPIGLTEQGFTVAFQQCMTPGSISGIAEMSCA